MSGEVLKIAVTMGGSIEALRRFEAWGVLRLRERRAGRVLGLLRLLLTRRLVPLAFPAMVIVRARAGGQSEDAQMIVTGVPFTFGAERIRG